MAEVKIVDARRIPSPDPERLGKWDLMVQYEADGGVRGIVRVPDEAVTDEAVKAAVKADLAGRAAWVGRKLQV